MYRPAVLRWLCADEACNAQCFRRRTVTTQLCFLLSTLLMDMMRRIVSYETPYVAAMSWRDSLCSITRCIITGHCSAGIPYIGCFGPGRRCLIRGRCFSEKFHLLPG